MYKIYVRQRLLQWLFFSDDLQNVVSETAYHQPSNIILIYSVILPGLFGTRWPSWASRWMACLIQYNEVFRIRTLFVIKMSLPYCVVV